MSGAATDTTTDPETAVTPISTTHGAPKSSLRRLIRLSLAEIRRLFNVRDQAKRIIHTAMGWSTFRRQHQAEARRHHFTRRLKIQYLAL